MNCAAAWMPANPRMTCGCCCFVKYVTDQYADDPNALIDVPLPEGDKPGGRFTDRVTAKGEKAIRDTLSKIVARLAEANERTVSSRSVWADESRRLPKAAGWRSQGRATGLLGNLTLAGIAMLLAGESKARRGSPSW